MNSKINVRYMRIEQKGLPFYLTKINALDLKSIVDFHFREPYSDLSKYKDQNFISLKKLLEKNDISFDENMNNTGVQRVINKKRVYEIKKFVEDDPNAIFPSTVLIAIDTSKADLELPELNEFGEFAITNDMHLSIIDGQHRLAGLFLTDDDILKEIEVPVVLLFNIDTPTAARLFQQINGKQQSVNKSIVFDLFENIEMADLINDDDKITKEYHTICKSLYTDPHSPLFRQIKMLGVGGGAISQSFFIESCKKELKFMQDWNIQDKYDILYSYFQTFQKMFPEDWPVPENADNSSYEDLDFYSNFVLRKRKSQLMKTNGFGAILKLLRFIHDSGIPYSSLSKLEGNVAWTNLDGTGDKTQNMLFEKLRDIIIQ